MSEVEKAAVEYSPMRDVRDEPIRQIIIAEQMAFEVGARFVLKQIEKLSWRMEDNTRVLVYLDEIRALFEETPKPDDEASNKP